jgi:putative addiction module CopG family antidote
MTTLSVPISDHLEKFVQKMVKNGHASNKADVVRKALTRLAEEEAVFAVLKAEQEPNVKGNLRDLMKKF